MKPSTEKEISAAVMVENFESKWRGWKAARFKPVPNKGSPSPHRKSIDRIGPGKPK